MSDNKEAKVEMGALCPYSHIEIAKLPYQTEYGVGSTPVANAAGGDVKMIVDVLVEVFGKQK